MDMIQKNLYSLLLLLILFSCGIRKNNTLDEVTPQTKELNYGRQLILSNLEEQTKAWKSIKAKIKAKLRIKDKSYTVRIQLQASNAKGIRLSVHYLLFEVARIWFTPNEVVFVDLINGAYARERYSDFGARLGLKLDYTQIERLIMGGIFVPGIGSDRSSLEALEYRIGDDGKQTLSGSVLGSNYTFLLGQQGMVEKLVVLDKKGTLIFDADYQSQSASVLPAMAPPSLHEYKVYKGGVGRGKEVIAEPTGVLSLDWQSVEHLQDDNEQVLIPKIKEKYFRVDLSEVLKFATSTSS